MTSSSYNRLPGVEVVKRFEDMGRMGISTVGLVMNDVKLPDYHRLGEEERTST